MDDADLTQEREQVASESAIDRIRAAAAEIKPGVAGECELCGEWSGRLIKGACAPCREKWRME